MCFELPQVAENVAVNGNGWSATWMRRSRWVYFPMVEASEVLIQPHGTDIWDAKTRLKHTDLLAGWQEDRPTTG